MTTEQRRWLIGGGVVSVLGLALWLQFSSAPSTPSSTSTRRPRVAAQKKEAAPQPVRPVRLEALDLSRDEPTDAQRNPFRFKPRVVAPPPRPVEPPRQINTAPVGPVTPPGPPPAPPIPLKFIGLVAKADGMKIAVLSDSKVTLYGREGDIIDGRYRIVKIGVESIELTYADGRGRQTIRLTGQ